jgi:hypothetical protein
MLKNIMSSRLRAEIAPPGTSPNTTCRFDRAGFVTEVELDGEIRFCATEPWNLPHPSSGGRGICNEYKFNSASLEAPQGSLFPKPGIGLFLKEDSESYIFHRKYKTTPFEISCGFEESKAVFETRPLPCMGHALRQRKTLEVSDNALSMEISLENTGERRFSALEYCHNFLSIGGMALGPDCRLEIPSLPDLGPRALDGAMIWSGRGITFSGHQQSPMGFEFFPEDISAAGPFEWTLSSSAAKAQVHCIEEIQLEGVYIWAADHMVSAEGFHSISIAPGEALCWKRVWRFERI